MSDLYISIIPKIKEYPCNKDKANEILLWLINDGIVKPDAVDCILGKDLGYPIGKNADSVVSAPQYLPYGLLTNGLEIITEQMVFDAGQFWDGDEESLAESNLGFTFWNWPEFTPQFIEHFKERLNCDVSVIIGKL